MTKCDCLNFCGDDPSVLNGTAEKCEEFKKYEKRKQDYEEMKKMLDNLHDRAVKEKTVVVTAAQLKRIKKYLL